MPKLITKNMQTDFEPSYLLDRFYTKILKPKKQHMAAQLKADLKLSFKLKYGRRISVQKNIKMHGPAERYGRVGSFMIKIVTSVSAKMQKKSGGGGCDGGEMKTRIFQNQKDS